MDWQEFFKPFALYGVLLSWIFGLWLTLRTKDVDVKTTSELALTSRTNYLIFAFGISIAGALLALCTYGYMRYELTVPDLYYYIYGFVLVLQFITAWVPDKEGWAHHLHYWSALTLYYFLLVIGGLLLVDGPTYNDQIQTTRGLQAFGLMMLLSMALMGIYAWRPGATNKQFLRSQQFYIIAFQLIVLARVY